MRKILLAGSAIVGMALSAGAHAAPLLAYQILDGSTVIGSGSSTTGAIVLAGSDTKFTVSGGASGTPFLASPDFSNNNFDLKSGGTGGTLTIRVTNTGLTNYGGGSIGNTFTLNSLTGMSFTTGTISNYFDGSNTAYGTSTLLATATFTGQNSFSRTTTASAAALTGPFSETTIYTLTFGNGAPSSISASSQLVATPASVPDPASMALLGVGLAAVGFVRRRKV